MESLKGRFRELFSRRPERREYFRELYHKVNRALGGSLGIIRHAFTNFTLMRGPEASASLSYYALFSIFPALVAVVSIGSFFLKQELVREMVLEAVRTLLPVSAATVNEQITTVFRLRGAVTAVALVSLVWSASNVFYKVIIHINRAFPHGHTPGFIKSRAMALLIILILAILFLVSLGFNAITEILPAIDFDSLEKNISQTVLWKWLSTLLPVFVKLLLFLGLYSWLPLSAHIRFRARFIGASVAAILWDLATRVLAWALSTGLANYELIYGSLASIMVLLFWLYLSGYILFFGAHLTNAINHHINHTQELLQSEEPVISNG